MRTLRQEFECHMSECGRSVGLRDEQGFYIADQVEQRWQSYQAATERAAKVVESGEPPRKLEGGRVEIGEGARNAFAAAIRSTGGPSHEQ